MIYYPTHVQCGVKDVLAEPDGCSITVVLHRAFTTDLSKKIGYQIFYSTEKDRVFSEGPKFLSIDDSYRKTISDLTPGQLYFFSARPFVYPNTVNLDTDLMTVYENLKLIPSTLLREDILINSLTIPILDDTGFPPSGLVRVGNEIIKYQSIGGFFDRYLNIGNIANRGQLNTKIRNHQMDGYDGYQYQNPNVTYFPGLASTQFDNIFMCQARMEYPNYAYTEADGYRTVDKDLLHSDLSGSDQYNQDFSRYDYSGYHRTDPVLLLTGHCVGSYIGGEQGCIDGYGNVNKVRGMDLQSANNQREEMALELIGRPAVLVKALTTGIRSNTFTASSEYHSDKSLDSYGRSFVSGYEQFYNPRRSDRRILVRASPNNESVKMQEAGLESEFSLEFWTLTVPTIKARDFIVLFDQEGNEEFRYEVISVGRNNTLVGLMGGQKLTVMRVRKTDPIYQFRIFRDASTMPTSTMTTINGTDSIPPHAHQIIINEKVPSQLPINHTTNIVQAHSHPIINNVVQVVLGHTHDLI